jgi:hypothetical protein
MAGMDLKRFSRHPRFPLLLSLSLYLLFCLATFRDYGCTWDEQDVYRGGAATFDHLVNGTRPPYLEPDHAYPYATLLAFLGLGEDYDLLHLANLLFAALLFSALYEVLYRHSGRPWLSLAGPLFLFLTPQFLGSVPANPKDIPFAVLYFLSLAVIVSGEGLRYRWVALGLLFGCAMASRMVGFTLLPVLFLFDVHRSGWTAWRTRGREWAGTLLLSQVVLAILWPFIGMDYFRNLPKVFEVSVRFPPKFEFLYGGAMVGSTGYPWHYLPVMVGITTPLFLLALAAASFFLARPWAKRPLFTLLTGTLLLNLLLYFLLRPALYDGLRHYLFLPPLIAALAAMGFIDFWTSKGEALRTARKAVLAMTALGVGATLWSMIKLHPYQYIYYNEGVGGVKGAYGRYETDYWVAGMREAVEWLKRNGITDPGRTYRIMTHGKPFQSEHWFLPNMKRVKEGEPADYSLIMTRAGIGPALGDRDRIIHRVERDGVPLVFVLKGK